jgi:hypothetical protein
MIKTRTNMLVLLSAAFAALAFAPARALADEDTPDIHIVSADVGGSGCPEGTASAVLSEDKRTLSIIFDEYMAEDNQYKSCNIAVGLHVPPGVTLALLDIDYRGYASIPDLKGRKGRFRSEYFFAGDTGPVRTVNFPRGYDANFMISHDLFGAVWAPCGAEVIARANTSIRTWGKGSFIIVDTADVTTNGVTFYLDWDYC